MPPPDTQMIWSLVTLAVGVVLWLAGGRLLRVGACLAGVALGVLLVFLFVAPPVGPVTLLVGVTLGAILGLALGWVLFRLWMGLTLSIVLSVLAPAIVLLFSDPEPAPAEPATHAQTVLTADHGPILLANAPTTREFHVDRSDVESLGRRAKSKVDPAFEAGREWWDALPPSAQQQGQQIAFGAGLFGLVFGLLVPQVAAMIQSSLLGASLILSSLAALSPTLMPGLTPHLPHDGKSFVVVVLLLAATGFVIQWTLRRPKADKEVKPSE